MFVPSALLDLFLACLSVGSLLLLAPEARANISTALYLHRVYSPPPLSQQLSSPHP